MSEDETLAYDRTSQGEKQNVAHTMISKLGGSKNMNPLLNVQKKTGVVRPK